MKGFRRTDQLAERVEHLAERVRQLNEQVEQLREENQALAHAANTDQRTGLPNAAAFEADHARCNGLAETYSLLLIDIDHFHGYNSIYRYLAGHETLRRIGQTINDVAGGRTYRYGGEEFTVLLPGTRLRDAVELAERIRLAVAGLGIEHTGNPNGVVTISVGAVEINRPTTVGHAIEEASFAVLEAKAAGRNQVVGV
jgi:diguanylate cyclase (GGDEF)-like protein